MIEEILWFIDTGDGLRLDCIGEFLNQERLKGETDDNYRRALKRAFWRKPAKQLNEASPEFRTRLLSNPPKLSRP